MRLALAALTVLTLAAPASAQAPEEQLRKLAENGRYQLLEVNDRVLRLDTSKGVFDECLLNSTLNAWKCSPTEDLSKVLRDQVEDLSRRVEALEAQLATQKAEDDKGFVDRLTDYVPGLK